MSTLNIPAAVAAALVTVATLHAMGSIADTQHREVLAEAANARTTVALATPKDASGSAERHDRAVRSASLKCTEPRCKGRKGA